MGEIDELFKNLGDTERAWAVLILTLLLARNRESLKAEGYIPPDGTELKSPYDPADAGEEEG